MPSPDQSFELDPGSFEPDRKSWGPAGTDETLQRRKGSKIFAAPSEHIMANRSTIHKAPNYLGASRVNMWALEIMTRPDFENLFSALIVLNAMQMGAALLDTGDQFEIAWEISDIFFAACFIFEASVILLALGHRTFTNLWKTVSVVVTLFSVGNVVMTLTRLGDEYVMTSKVLSSLRFLLVFKLFALNRETKLIVVSMVRSFKSLKGVLIVITVICYGSTLIVFNIVGSKEDDYNEKEVLFGTSSHFTYFGTVPRTLLTLFSVLILSEWDSVARGVYEIQPWFVFFFVGFTTLTTFGLLNVLVGLVVDTVNQIHTETVERRRNADLAKQKVNIEKLMEIVFKDDDDITLDEWLDVTEDNPAVASLLGGFNVPWHFTYGDLFQIIDDDQDGHVTKMELSDGLFSLTNGDSASWFCMSQLKLSYAHADIRVLKEMVVKLVQNEPMNVGGIRTSNASAASGQSMETDFTFEKHERPRGRPIGMQIESKQGRTPPTSSDDLWRKCYSSVHSAVARHCERELDIAMQSLRGEWTRLDASSQANYLIRKKLQSAVSSESEIALGKAIDLAIAAGIDSSALSIELTYRDVLKRSQPRSLPTKEVQSAMENGDWSTALGLIVESAVVDGADKHVLATVITRISDSNNIAGAFQSGLSRSPTKMRLNDEPEKEWSFGSALANTPTQSGSLDTAIGRKLPASPIGSGSTDEANVPGRAGNIRKLPNLKTKFRNDALGDSGVETQLQLLSILQSEAYKHCSREMNKALAVLDDGKQSRSRANKVAVGDGGVDEERVFVYNQMTNAVERKSLPDLQVALTQAMVAGLDIRSFDIEIAYRDALGRYHKGTAHTVRLAVDAFQRKEWYLALELAIQICIARGADRQALLRALTKIFARPTVADSTLV